MVNGWETFIWRWHWSRTLDYRVEANDMWRLRNNKFQDLAWAATIMTAHRHIATAIEPEWVRAGDTHCIQEPTNVGYRTSDCTQFLDWGEGTHRLAFWIITWAPSGVWSWLLMKEHTGNRSGFIFSGSPTWPSTVHWGINMGSQVSWANLSYCTPSLSSWGP